MLITDQVGSVLVLNKTPERIISLVPSQTELLVDLGLKDRIVGITKFCVHPTRLRKEVTIVGGTKKVDYNKIIQLKPDIIFCNKEENTKEMVEQLRKICLVHVSDVITLDDSYELIEQYGSILDTNEKAAQISRAIVAQQSSLRQYIDTSKTVKKRVGYFIWQDPLMVVGNSTFINTLLEEIGFKNAFVNKEGRYPEIRWSDLAGLDYIFLSSEPYPFKEKHIEVFSKRSKAKIILVNGEYFSWYGSRLAMAFPYFKKLITELEL